MVACLVAAPAHAAAADASCLTHPHPAVRCLALPCGWGHTHSEQGSVRGNTGGYTERWVRVIEGRLHFYNTLAVSTAYPLLCSALLCSALLCSALPPVLCAPPSAGAGVHTHTCLLTPCRCVSWLAACLLPGCLPGWLAGWLAGCLLAVCCLAASSICISDTQSGEKTSLFAPFIYKMHYFAKTGPGQT